MLNNNETSHKKPDLQHIYDNLRNMGIEFTDRHIKQLSEFLRFLQKWNSVYNLTSEKDLHNIYYRHISDSLQYLKTNIRISSGPIVDLGSGAGFPGLPLSLFLENEIYSVDKVERKIDFQFFCKSKLGLNNFHPQKTNVFSEGLEQFQPKTIITRSFRGLDQLLNMALKELPSGGKLVSWNNSIAKEDIVPLDGLELIGFYGYMVPEINFSSNIIEILKQ